MTHYLLPSVCMSDTHEWYYYVYTIKCLIDILYLKLSTFHSHLLSVNNCYLPIRKIWCLWSVTWHYFQRNWFLSLLLCDPLLFPSSGGKEKKENIFSTSKHHLLKRIIKRKYFLSSLKRRRSIIIKYSYFLLQEERRRRKIFWKSLS